MKFKKYLTIILLPTLVHAQQGSHGGDTRCEEFYQLASEISISLAKLGQERLNSINPLINIIAIRDVLLHPVQVLPAHNLDRQALSNPDSIVTQLDVDQWDGMERPKRIKLVSHELLVLTRKEADGEYLITEDLTKALSETPLLAEPEFHGIEHVKNEHGSTTFYFRSQLIWAGSNDVGVCKFISKNFDTARNKKSVKHSVYIRVDDPQIYPAIIDENGVKTGKIHKDSFRRITQIDCA